jgi:hypothetical protein
MTSVSDKEYPPVRSVDVTDDLITMHLADGSSVSCPLADSWRLADATPAQRANWRIIGGGHGINWPDIDEDLSVWGMFHGRPAKRPKSASPPPAAAQ